MMSSPEGFALALDHGGIDVYTIEGSMSKWGAAGSRLGSSCRAAGNGERGEEPMRKSKGVRRGVTVAFWWFMLVSQQPNQVLTAATQGPFVTQAQCEWGRQQIGVTTGLRGGQGVGWGTTQCWNDSP